MASFDPNAAAIHSGIYGLPHTEEESRIVLLPVPFDATTSYRRGAARGPSAILEASRQVDLYDREVGRPYEAGIFLRPEDENIKRANQKAKKAADPVIEAGGHVGGDPALAGNLLAVNELSKQMNGWVHERTREILGAGKVAGIVGGDHSTPFGAIQAYAERHPGMGILHIDAHADLRPAYEGFTFSHASIMHNVYERVDRVARIVQVGIRDFSEGELGLIDGSHGRIVTFFDADMARQRFEGASWASIVQRIVGSLPQEVYVSFDIDGLDPSLCPHTGTPVPGGLGFSEASFLLGAVVSSGRRIVGFDLNEVAPGPPGDEWDANVGARMLYKMIGHCLRSLTA